tara:strand:+ start:2870 stop:3307 length:438 start_codon:yes stop_codon:yes gene_type:complete
MKLNISEIKKLLPHRSPFLLIDSCEIIEVGEVGKGYRKFLINEYFFEGHFPNNPIVPGVILIESLAQTAGTVISHSLSYQHEKTVLFMSVANAKFRKPVLPNDEIIFNVNLLNKFKSVYKFYGEAIRNSEKVCEAVFSAMIIDKK